MHPPLLTEIVDGGIADFRFQQSREQVFTTLTRIMAFIGTLFLILACFNYQLTPIAPMVIGISSMLTILWLITLLRRFSYTLRGMAFIALWLALVIVEYLNFGCSIFCLIYLTGFCISAAMFGSRQIGFGTFLIALLLIAVGGALILSGRYTPHIQNQNALPYWRNLLQIELIFSMVIGALTAGIINILETLNDSFAREQTARALIEQERQLLEIRVTERTAGLIAEIEQRKIVEKQLQKLSRAVESSPTSIVITDLNGTIEYVNSKFTTITGYSRTEAWGQNPRILSSGQTPSHTYQDLWATLQTGLEWHGQFCNRKKNGELFWEQASISPVADGEGKITHYVAVKEDITRQRELEKLRDDLIHTMVHDLRNPLTGILISMQLLNKREAPNLQKSSQELINIAASSGEHMLNLVNSILDISRLENGQMPIHSEPITIPEIVTEILHYQTTLITTKELQVKVDLAPSLPQLWGDRNLTKRIIQNLVGNSIKFTPSQGTIRLTATQARHDPDWIEISIGNNGPTIEPELKNRLFQKFVTGSHEARGSGLGLAFCKLAVEAHGGRIEVESEEGQETTFHFTLPAAH